MRHFRLSVALATTTMVAASCAPMADDATGVSTTPVAAAAPVEDPRDLGNGVRVPPYPDASLAEQEEMAALRAEIRALRAFDFGPVPADGDREGWVDEAATRWREAVMAATLVLQRLLALEGTYEPEASHLLMYAALLGHLTFVMTDRVREVADALEGGDDARAVWLANTLNPPTVARVPETQFLACTGVARELGLSEWEEHCDAWMVRAARVRAALGVEPPDVEGGARIRSSEVDEDGEDVEGCGPEAIRRVVQSRRDDVRQCYEDALLEDPDIEGRIVIRFIIAPEGHVEAASVAVGIAPDLDACIVGVARSLRFRPCSNERVGVEYPFRLQTR